MIKAIKTSILLISNESCSLILYKITLVMKKIIINLLTMTMKTVVKIISSALMNNLCC